MICVLLFVFLFQPTTILSCGLSASSGYSTAVSETGPSGLSHIKLWEKLVYAVGEVGLRCGRSWFTLQEKLVYAAAALALVLVLAVALALVRTPALETALALVTTFLLALACSTWWQLPGLDFLAAVP